MVRLSGWVREQNAAGVVPVPITPERAGRVAQMRMPLLRDRASRVLAIIARKWPGFDASFALDFIARDLEVLGSSYSSDHQEAIRLIEILNYDGYFRPNGMGFALSVKGLLTAEALGASGSGAQGFVAMWFDASTNEAWLSGFEPGIKAAGYHPVRLDREDYVGGVTDEIMTQIRRSRFVVVDYTGHRNSVYFEAG